MDYPGKVITKTQVTPTQTSASGNWTLDDQAAAIKNNNWPVALVPNPISKSLRFNSADTAYLNRTPASASNQKTWTWSGWVKRSALGSSEYLFAAGTGGTDTTQQGLNFQADNTLRWTGASTVYLVTTQVFRDPSAWYHIVFVFDTTQATANNRQRIYVNGVQITAFSTQVNPTQNLDYAVNQAAAFNIGRWTGASNYFNGYLTEINFIDSPVLVGSTTNASTTVTLTTGTTTNIGIGWSVGGTNIPSGATVSSITNSTQFVISSAATGTGSSISIGVTPPVTAFGLTNPQTGQWIPKKYTGTYGTNGFYLNFKDATSTTTLGYDYSGNANNWTTNNFSVTAGSGNDSLTDVPTPWVAYNTTGDVGGVVRGNYATMNPVASVTTPPTFTNGNLEVTGPAAGVGATVSTFGGTSGKFYAEVTVTRASDRLDLGIAGSLTASTFMTSTNYLGTDTNTIGYGTSTGVIRKDNANNQTGLATCTTGDVVGMAIDMDSGTIQFYKNNSTVGTAVSFTPSAYGSFLVAQTTSFNTSKGTYNFGQRPFAYTPPAGFRSLCTTNLPATTIGFGLTNQGNNYFDATTYTGTGTTLSITNSGSMQPDFVWIKIRSLSFSHNLQDAVRGSNKVLLSDLTSAEQTQNAGHGVTSFNSNGFTLGLDSSTTGSVNANGGTFVAWQWKAAGSTVSNTAGTITSTVSANTTAGFSIVTYTGNGTNGATVGHGLGVAPSLIFIKNRGAVASWLVYSASIGASNFLVLNTTDASAASALPFNNTAPTSSVFSLGTSGGTNTNTGTYVAYCFAAVPGYSAFGSYTGNNSADGPFVYLGFRPAFVLIKATNTTQWWTLLDSKRDTYNVSTLGISPNSSDAESTFNTNRGPHNIDFTSNGFKIRTSGSGINGTNTFIYAAFAESPFQFANAR